MKEAEERGRSPFPLSLLSISSLTLSVSPLCSTSIPNAGIIEMGTKRGRDRCEWSDREKRGQGKEKIWWRVREVTKERSGLTLFVSSLISSPIDPAGIRDKVENRKDGREMREDLLARELLLAQPIHELILSHSSLSVTAEEEMSEREGKRWWMEIPFPSLHLFLRHNEWVRKWMKRYK